MTTVLSIKFPGEPWRKLSPCVWFVPARVKGWGS